MNRWGRPIGATVAIVLLVLGVPLLLIRVAGYPLPRHGLDVAHMRQMVQQGEIPAEFVIKTIAVIVWIAWAQLVWALAWELIVNRPGSRRRHRPAPFVPRLMSLGAARLIAAVVAVGIVGTSAVPNVASARPAAMATVADAASGSATAIRPIASLRTAAGAFPGDVVAPADKSAAPATVAMWRVAESDTLWDIAERALGDGSRVNEVLDLNPHVGSARSLRPGQVLTLPDGAFVPGDRRPDAGPIAAAAPPVVSDKAGHVRSAVPDARAAAPSLTGDVVHTVVDGDTVWDILEAHYGRVDADMVWAVADMNGLDDPSTIFSGATIRLPADPSAPAPPVTAPAGPAPGAPMPPPAGVGRSSPADLGHEAIAPAGVASHLDDLVAGDADPAPSTTSTTAPDVGPIPPDTGAAETADPASPAPIGLGEAGLISAGIIALVSARRRARLRSARAMVRLPEPPARAIDTERALRRIDVSERYVRVDVAIRAAAADVVNTEARLAVAQVGADGNVTLTFTESVQLPAPWIGSRHRWAIPGSTPIELLAERARSVGAPCLALVQVGVDQTGADVLVDLEAAGLLTVVDRSGHGDDVVRAIAAGLATSPFAEPTMLIGVGIERRTFIGRDDAVVADDIDAAVSAVPGLVGPVPTGRSTFALRARHTGGEAWEPAVVLVAATPTPDEASLRALAAACDGPLPLAAVVAMTHEDSPVAGRGALWVLRSDDEGWTLQPHGLRIRPVGVTLDELDRVEELLAGADAPLVADDSAFAPSDLLGGGDRDTFAPQAADAVTGRADDGRADERAGSGRAWLVAEPGPAGDGPGDERAAEPADEPAEPRAGSGNGAGAGPGDERAGAGPVEADWSLMVRVLGPVEVVDRDMNAASFSRSKPLELLAWLAVNRDHPTRRAARTALWELDVRDATFANVVSEARRTMRGLVEPATGQEWLARTVTDRMPLHVRVVSDADVVRSALHQARLQPPEQAIATLRPAVELIRGLPFADAGYLWPDSNGMTSNLILLSTAAASELAGHYLSIGDIDGVFWATGRGLNVLSGHEELIALRMRAHHQAGDLAGVRAEWASYERVLRTDLFSDGEPARKLVDLRRDLLS